MHMSPQEMRNMPSTEHTGPPSHETHAPDLGGISPYWFDIELTGYVGEEGRTAVRLKTEYDLYLTQRLILKPEIEFNAYGIRPRAANWRGPKRRSIRAAIALRALSPLRPVRGLRL